MKLAESLGVQLSTQDLHKIMPPEVYVAAKQMGLNPYDVWTMLCEDQLGPLVEDGFLKFGVDLSTLPTPIANAAYLHGIHLLSTMYDWQNWTSLVELPPMHPDIPAGFEDENLAWLAEQTKEAVAAYQGSQLMKRWGASKAFLLGLLPALPIIIALLWGRTR